MNHAYDLTQAERQDAFGTTDIAEIIEVCERYGIQYCMDRSNTNLVVWRCHLTRRFKLKLILNESMGKRYTEMCV